VSEVPHRTTELATPTPIASSTPSLTVDLEAVGTYAGPKSASSPIAGSPGCLCWCPAVLANADVLVGNLECALTSSDHPQPKTYTFAHHRKQPMPVLAGFDVLSLANNHAMDYGTAGLVDT